MPPSFALLDDARADENLAASRLYTDLIQHLSCTDAAQFSGFILQMEAALRQGYFAVAVWTYELGAQLQGVFDASDLAKNQQSPSHILIYKQCQKLNRQQVAAWLAQQNPTTQQANQFADIAGIANLQPSVNEQQFNAAIDQIQHYLSAGDSYQVNYTYRLRFTTYGNALVLYQRLRAVQPVPFGALIVLPDGAAVLSFSPELFIAHNDQKLTAQPMKGTALAQLADNNITDEQAQNINQSRSQTLANDPKNRAENVMIVDLLRNDLGRIATVGSVNVPHLFQVQQFNQVLQMTSTVTALLQNEVTLFEVIIALFPCGSITGAPKVRTLQIIKQLENTARGIYTGAIGWFDPIKADAPAKTVPNFCLSVPIRTLQLSAPMNAQSAPHLPAIRNGVMGVGAGIVMDSIAADEYQECAIKARFLTRLPAQFSLFETMRVTQNGFLHQARHLSRLIKSAQFFGIPCDVISIQNDLNACYSSLKADTVYRLKLSLNGRGQISLQHAPLVELNTPVKVLLTRDNNPIQHSDNIFLQHKTTLRADYDLGWQQAEQQGAFDTLFINQQGEITEGGRSNLLVKINGQWKTPPLSSGVLAGVMRAVLMDDPVWQLQEQRITIDDLKAAQDIALCNALRGVMPAVLVWV